MFSFYPGAKLCQHPVDIAFLVDSSGSISRKNYVKIKSFVIDFARRFDISTTGSRSAVILYSRDAEKYIDFNEKTNFDDFAKAVQGLPHQKGSTRIDRALQVGRY